METTRAEKFLAFVLAAFVLIGVLWVYFQPLDRSESLSYPQGQQVGSPADVLAVQRAESARRDVRGALRAERERRSRLELAREDYRTALEAGRPAAALQEHYRRARDAEARASEALRRARR
ncbi:MAG TPA: hypothetical protein VE570_11930, partial [Thermoleophilaceae bacterium]|nr:hypothetical protein [Thermoleophilaceae bacterium]